MCVECIESIRTYQKMSEKPSTTWKLSEMPSATLNILEAEGEIHVLNKDYYNTGRQGVMFIKNDNWWTVHGTRDWQRLLEVRCSI